MVTQNMMLLESHLSLPSKPPPILENNEAVMQSQTQLIPEKKILNREDPMSHRIIEKRRRDRMNNCLADLSRLIPADYLKKGRGRIEKTEIIEMAIKHMKYLHNVVCSRPSPTSELPKENSDTTRDNFKSKSDIKEDEEFKTTENPSNRDNANKTDNLLSPINLDHFKLGYQECLSESMHFLVEVKGHYPGSSLCMQLICHLQKHCDKILKGDRLNKPRTGDSTSTSPGSVRPHGPGSSSSDSCERLPKQEPIDTVYDTNNPLYLSRDNFDVNTNREQFERAVQNQRRLHSYPTPNQNSPYELNSNVQPRDGVYPNIGPQSAENLTAPNLSIFNFEQDNQGSGRVGLCETNNQLESYPTETSPCLSANNDNQSLYKFKNNIKQRFRAEHSIHQNDSSSGYVSAPPTKKSRSNEPTTKYYDSPSNDSNCCDLRSNDFSSDISRNHDLPSRNVAIFVLHTDGTFYIPLTVDSTVLSPYLGNIKTTYRRPLVLHPVTISVCFQQKGRSIQESPSGNSASSDFSRNSHLKPQK